MAYAGAGTMLDMLAQHGRSTQHTDTQTAQLLFTVHCLNSVRQVTLCCDCDAALDVDGRA
jgi:hypothetical protein